MTAADALRGAIAGAAGGIVGGALKLACEAVVPPRPPGRQPPPAILVARAVRAADGRELDDDEKERAAMTVHWIFSIASGAAHGVAVEIDERACEGDGIPFGLLIWAGFHEIALPLLGATPPVPELPASEHVNEFVTHAAYGFAVERTRRAIRPLLAPL